MIAAGIAEYVSEASSDAVLVAAVRAGDDAAFEELYRRYQPGLARFVRGRVRDHGRAEDVTQEAFVSALRRLRQNDAEIAFRPWVYEIARNATIDLHRRSSRAEEVSIDVDGALAPADARRLSADGAPDSSMLRRERFDHLRGALDELSETHHRVIVLRELEGRSYREIGEFMELSPAAVESTLFRARRKLEKEYEELDTGRRCRVVDMAIKRLAEGVESDRDRLRLDRHARRCSACRRRARQLRVEPLLEERPRRLAARAAAFLPLPAFARPTAESDAVKEACNTAGSCAPASAGSAALAPSIEIASGAAGKIVAVIATAAVIGGGGATLGGVGPLAMGGKARVADELPAAAEPAAGVPAGGRPAAREAADGRGHHARHAHPGRRAPREDSDARRAKERGDGPEAAAGLRGSTRGATPAQAPPAAAAPAPPPQAPSSAPLGAPPAAAPGVPGAEGSALPTPPPGTSGGPSGLPAPPTVPDVAPAVEAIAGTAAKSAEAAARAGTEVSAAGQAAGA